ncbi:hypothetical protein CAP35_08585 [Chitinophagaceae bacterium IBVUCB1]|nr:hypothetical protein CAP35_08585 [Chitinophagaceae bacterium IBVUCB1]
MKKGIILLVCLLQSVSLYASDSISFYTEKSPRLRGMMVPTYMGEKDLRDLASWGANHIRWQLTWGGSGAEADKADRVAYRQWLNGALEHLDKMLPICNELGIKVLIDLHTLPGGRIDGFNNRMFSDKGMQDEFIDVWKYIADKYKDNSTVWGYDVANEPQDVKVANGAVNWPTLASMVCHEVRAIDAKHPIIVEARGGDVGTLVKFQTIDVPGLVYSFHMYVPHSFTHQNIYGNTRDFHYPGFVGIKWWNTKVLRKELEKIRDWQIANNAQIYVGEFSAIRWAPNEDAHDYLKDCIDVFEEFGWSWAYHAFREYHGWSVEHGNVKTDENPTKEPTKRMQLFMKAFKKNAK